ncbi:6168_t:CDS:1, partial [Racocetra persica]
MQSNYQEFLNKEIYTLRTLPPLQSHSTHASTTHYVNVYTEQLLG